MNAVPFDYATAFELLQSVLILALGALLSLARDMIRDVQTGHKELEQSGRDLAQKLTLLEVTVARDYIPRAEYASDVREIRRLLETISDKLDHKADKQ
jgi:hypothetical protein